MSTVPRYTTFETARGFCSIAWGEFGISGFCLPAESAEDPRRAMLRRHPTGVEAEPMGEIGRVIERVKTYFVGDVVDFSDLLLDLSGQTDLYRRIYDATRRLGWGKATTYGRLAGELELGPAGAWTIGQAMAKNPIPLIIPCHRVLAAGGKLGGFSAPGGTLSKQRMLELEGLPSVEASPAQQSFGF
ncbi:methylated-DNA--protein-cysteine methyltransferase [Agrobacterium albertimagni AOL15]|uniref:Methylated-DNA--protein-cysteine methyltransferase n=1 Tax=Agrobacterium albertimagni AOL15 TaxID=1156935 RepID=K2QH52_9HYPH|nr:methylated-DNA--[protein]-cysteine S-methyltransferase [Agrobacterium albertimagni]EKF60431.1 methylated-DNA--protein-cysteine methyltransferase [Agrobacterium albertimagni AOL15]